MKLKTPILIINLKTYIEGTGWRALELGRDAESVAKELGVEIALAVQPSDIYLLSSNLEIPILAQHIDHVEAGAYTGHILAEAIKEAGAVGTLLNHSERRLRIDVLDKCIRRAKSVGLDTIVCADTPQVASAVAMLEPDMVAIEPPELIGTGISVSKAKPEVITETLNLIRKVNPKIPVITGAGISSGDDVAKAIELGTVGVLVASAIVKAKNRRDKIYEMAQAILKATGQL